jgi:uncharacterized protein YqeY
MRSGAEPGVRQRLRRALPAAMKARDRAAVSALRSALAAIENAEAADASSAPAAPGTAEFAGSVVGLGAGEVARRTVTEADAVAIVRAEIGERLSAADGYDSAGRSEHAERLRAEAAALAGHLSGDPATG